MRMTVEEMIQALTKMAASSSRIVALSESQFVDFEVYRAANGTVVIEVDDVGLYREKVERGEGIGSSKHLPPT